MREHVSEDGLIVGRVALREETPEVLTIGEAASLLRLDEDQVLQAAQQGELPARRIASDWRFSRLALLSWLRGDQPQRDDGPPEHPA